MADTTVLIPHPSQMLELIQMQKKIIASSYKSDCILYPLYPLWFVYPSQISSLKDIRTQIHTFTVCSPQLLNSILVFPVQINGEVQTNGINAAQAYTANGVLSDEFSSFRLDCRIFRAAHASFSSYAWQVHESIWIKL